MNCYDALMEDDRTATPSELFLLFKLLHYSHRASSTHEAAWTINEIAALVKKAPRHAAKLIADCKAKGLLETSKRDGQTFYRVTTCEPIAPPPFIIDL